jgi:hypothetical protein
MKKTILGAASIAVMSMSMAATPALARHDDHHDNGYRDRRGNHYYDDGRGHYSCKRSNGTTGTIIGAVGGGLAGNLLGGGTLGTLAGAGGGALLGRSIDRGHVKCR